MAPDAEPAPRRRFVLHRTLGEGSFGAVYLADMEGAGGFKRRVALKILHRTWDPGSDAGRRLRDEARLLGRLEHRHIVRVDDLVRVNGQWALVMEYINGADLETVFNVARMKGMPVPARVVADLGAAVASALDAAWAAVGDFGVPLRVIHRDIKPSNIRLAESGDIKVLDFGVARAEFAGREARTERVRYGSLGYMAPERLLGEPETPAGDIYALGVILYELAVLETYGRAELAVDAQAAQVQRGQDAIVERLGTDGVGLAALFARAVSYRPDDRPSAAELERELRLLTRTMTGEDVTSFARLVFPLLGISGPYGPDPIEGTVMEEATTTMDLAPPEARVESSSGTITLPDETVEPLPAPTPSRPPFGLIGAGVALSLLVLIGIAWWAFGSAPPEAAVATTPPVDAATTLSMEVPPAADAPVGPPSDPAVVADGTGRVPAEPAVAPVVPSAGTTRGPTTNAAPARPAPTSGGAVAPPTGATSLTATTTSSGPPAEAASPVPPSAPAATSSQRLRAAKFTLTGAEGITVVCGDVRGSGATNALVREFPAGPCVVSAGGQSTTLTIDSPRGVTCAVAGGTLTCR